MTDDEVLGRPGWTASAVHVLEAGGAEIAIHIRGPATESRTLLALAAALAPHARRTGASLFVNDRVDIALVADLDGVQLGGGSLPPERARALLGARAWVGVSRHTADGVAGAGSEGADYVFLGTIFPTASHPGVRGIGVAALVEALRRAKNVPVLGIGGVGPSEVAELVAAGAYGVAAIRGIWDAPDPGVAVKKYLEGVGNRREQK